MSDLKDNFLEQESESLRQQICNGLGFEIALIEQVTAEGFSNLATLLGDNVPEGVTLEDLLDENGESLSDEACQLSAKVRAEKSAYLGQAFGPDDQDPEANKPLPYGIIPICQTAASGAETIKAVVRIVSFNSSKAIAEADIAAIKNLTLKLLTRLAALDSEPAKAESSKSDSAKSDAAAAPKGPETILIAHMDRAVRRRLLRTLVSKPYQVLEADTADKTIAALAENPETALIVLDVQITNSTGEMLVKSLKKQTSAQANLPIIIVTPESDTNSKIQGFNAGADDCISDSYIDAELLARVRTCLGLRNIASMPNQLGFHSQVLTDKEKEASAEAERLAKQTWNNKQNAELDAKNKELSAVRFEKDVLLDQAKRLNKISDCIRKSFHVKDNITEVLEWLASWHELDNCFAVLTEECEESDAIRCEYARYEGDRLQDKDFDVALLKIFKDLPKQDLLLINDVKRDRRIEPFKEVLNNYHLYSAFYAPVTYENRLIGILGGHKIESQAQWNQHYETFFGQIADQIAIGVINARLYNRVERQATTDGLTGLFNHRTGQEKLSEQLRMAERARHPRPISIVMMDIDHFKSINDTYGHPVGDTVLKSVAQIIRGDCRNIDIPVRYGGEEFLIVLPDVDQDGAVALAERFRKTLQREVISHGEVQLSVTASIGVATHPDDAQSQHQLLELADKALYMSKRLGRNQVHTAADLLFHDLQSTPEKKVASVAAPEQEQSAQDEPLVAEESSQVQFTTMEPTAVHAVHSEPMHSEPIYPDPTYAEPQYAEPAYSEAAHSEFMQSEEPHIPPYQAPIIEPSHSEPSEPSALVETHSSTADQTELVPEVVEMVKAMAGALYAKSEYNKIHHLETARFAETVAKVLGLNQKQIEQIRVAGLLHDVGLLSVPEDILNKPGQVTAEELRVLMQHPIMGAEMFRPIHALKEICEILENHHECWDGTGYPRGLKGEDIPLAARIISIVDAYHAMISDRPYRPAMTKERAIKVLRNSAGSQFDPFLVDIFISCIAEESEATQ